MELKKKCKACLEEKDLCKFYNLKSSKDGKNPKCIDCKKVGALLKKETSSDYKNCKACNVSKKLTDYPKQKENRDGRHGKCRECVKNKISIEIINIKEGYKICTSCKEVLQVSCFIKDKYRPDGLAGNCKICRKKNQEKIKSVEKTIPSAKKCNRCNLIKDKKEFNKNSNSYNDLDSTCKSCRTEKYYEDLKKELIKIERYDLLIDLRDSRK